MEHQNTLFIGIAVLVLLIGLVVLFLTRKDRKRVPNYRALFILGIVFIPISISSESIPLMAVSFVFMLISLVNRKKWEEEKKWSELSQQDKRIRLLVLAIGIALFLAGIVFFFLQN